MASAEERRLDHRNASDLELQPTSGSRSEHHVDQEPRDSLVRRSVLGSIERLIIVVVVVRVLGRDRTTRGSDSLQASDRGGSAVPTGRRVRQELHRGSGSQVQHCERPHDVAAAAQRAAVHRQRHRVSRVASGAQGVARAQVEDRVERSNRRAEQEAPRAREATKDHESRSQAVQLQPHWTVSRGASGSSGSRCRDIDQRADLVGVGECTTTSSIAVARLEPTTRITTGRDQGRGSKLRTATNSSAGHVQERR